MAQPATLTKQKAAADKKSAPTFTASLLGVFLLLTSGSGRFNFCSYWRSSVGWILCWDDADADDYVADNSVCRCCCGVLLMQGLKVAHFPTTITYYC